MKKFIAAIFALLFVGAFVRVYDSSELTAEVLENRIGRIVVERCVGVVTDAERGDGKLLNAEDPEYSYIGYRNLGFPVSDGAEVLSYMVYNPINNGVDDIILRLDFPISNS